MHKTIFVVVAGSLLNAGVASAHIQLVSPPDRFTNNSLSPGPCGSGTRSTKPATKLVPGQTLVVSWKEVVSHAGHYRIALSAKESDFTDPTSLSIPNPSPSWVLLDGILDKTGNQTYSQSVAIPNKECPACVLQVIQVASGGSDGTNTGTLGAIYHTCADVSVGAGASDAGVAPDAAVASDARGDGPAVVDGAAGASGGAGHDGSGGSLASSGGTSAASAVTGGTGGNRTGGAGAGGSSEATGGQPDNGGVSSGGTTSDGDSVGSVASEGGSSSAAGSSAGQGGGGHAIVGESSSSSGAAGASGGASVIATARSSTGGSLGEGSKAPASAGCRIGQRPGKSPWPLLAIALLVRALLRRKVR